MPFASQRGAADQLQLMQLDCLDRQGRELAGTVEHARERLARQAEDHVDAERPALANQPIQQQA